MHLGLIDGPFVPHNLISAKDSPVPLPKFQMAPRLKILMSSWSKKGTKICYTFSQKSRQATPLQVPQRGPYGEMPVSRAFLNISSRVPSKGALPRGPLHWGSSERDAALLEPPSSTSQRWPLSRFPSGDPMDRDAHRQSLFYVSSRVPSKGALPPGFLHRAAIGRDAPPPGHLSAISQSPQ